MKTIFIFFLGFIPLAAASEEPECTDIDAITEVAPEYPRYVSPRGQTGFVVVSFKISDRGYVYNPTVEESFSSDSKRWIELFEIEALKAIKKWKFKYRVRSCRAKHTFKFELAE